MKIAQISIQRPTVVVVTFAILIFFGIFSYRQLNQELFPSVSMQTIMVGTLYPGAGPAEVENSVTRKLEDALSSLEGIKDISSVSMESFSLITIRLRHGVDIDKVMTDAQRKINAIKAELPEDCKESSIDKYDISQLPIMNIGATSTMPDIQFYDFVKYTVKPAIERITGVARVELIGGSEREIQVNLNEDKLKAYGLSVVQVAQTLITSNLDFPAGKVKDDNRQILLRLDGKYQSISDIENVILHVLPGGGIVKTTDVAEVYDTRKETTTVNRVNGITSIGISVNRQTDANSVAISREIEHILATLQTEHTADNLTFELAQNESEFTIEATDSVLVDLLLAILFVAATMLLFLHSLRNSLIVIVAIPTSLVSTFIIMYLLGFTLNLASLLALSLVIGILVDDAIVVVENIHRHLEMGKSRMQAAYDGIREIGATIVSITLVLVVVFIPVSLTSTIVSDLFRSFCVTVAAATLLSLFVSFTIVPLMLSRIGKLEQRGENSLIGRLIYKFEHIISRMAAAVRTFLSWSFNHKLLVFSVTALLFIASLALIPLGFIGSEFARIGDRGEFYLDIELPRNATIEQTNLVALQAESIIRSHPLVTTVFTTVGAADDGQPQPYLAEILVRIVPHKQRKITTDDCSREIKLALQRQIVGAKITTALSGLTGGKDIAPLEIIITGNHPDVIAALADTILAGMNTVKGIIDAKLSLERGNPEISIHPDRDRMARLGVTYEMLGASLNLAFSGNRDAKFRGGDNEYDINIRLDEFDRRNIRSIENFSVTNIHGLPVRLSQFAAITETEGAARLERRNRTPSISVTSQISGRSLGDIGADVIANIDRMNLPSDVRIEYGGDLENQEEGFGSLGFAMLVSILLVYLIMVLLYNNYVYPFAVLFSIPLALIGALLAMALAMENLSIFTIMGMIMLVGLVAKNAILVVDFANQLQSGGMEIKEALLEATQKRFRPILMTAISTVVGMLPIALAQGAGADWKNGLAWVLIGGLLSSTILTLVIVPLVYYLLFRILRRLGWQ